MSRLRIVSGINLTHEHMHANPYAEIYSQNLDADLMRCIYTQKMTPTSSLAENQFCTTGTKQPHGRLECDSDESLSLIKESFSRACDIPFDKQVASNNLRKPLMIGSRIVATSNHQTPARKIIAARRIHPDNKFPIQHKGAYQNRIIPIDTLDRLIRSRQSIKPPFFKRDISCLNFHSSITPHPKSSTPHAKAAAARRAVHHDH